MKIGFIGLGLMGSRMANNLLDAGYEMVVYNRTKEKTKNFSKKNTKIANTPAETANLSDIIFTMLSTPEAVRETALGVNGFLSALKENSIWVDCSTVNPSFSKEMAAKSKERGVRFLDAPVSGTIAPAEEGELVFYVGGEEETFLECKPLLNIMGKKVVYLGESGMGTSMKMINNIMLGVSMAAFSEAVQLGESLGISRELIFNNLIGGPVIAPFLAEKKDKIINENYDAEFPLKWMYKDLHLALLSGYENEIALPTLNNVKELYGLASNHGFAEKDFSALYSFLSRKRSK